MGKDEYESLDEKPYDSFHLYAETTLDYPIQKVWPHALNIGGWMSAHRLETISGEAGKVGHFERVYPHGVSEAVPLPHYHLYGITHINPYKLIVLEVFPEKSGSYGLTRQRMSFDSLFFSDLDHKTQMGFHMIDVHMGNGGVEFRENRQRELIGVREMLNRYFDNLRQLIKQGG